MALAEVTSASVSCSNPPTSPQDPDWVEAIVARALERSETAADEIESDTSDDLEAPLSVSDGTPVGDPAEPLFPAIDDAEHPAEEDEPLFGDYTPSGLSSSGLEGARGLSTHAADPLSSEDVLPDLFAVESVAPGAPMVTSSPTAGQWGATELAGEPPYYDDDPLFDQALGPAPAPITHDEPRSARIRSFLEWGAVIVGALAVALLIKTFLMQAYYIPSGSMEPTLNIDDRVLVNKLSYEFGDIGRGDLIVFHRPPGQIQGEDDLIKRVIGLPGETIQIQDGSVYILPVGSTELRGLREPYISEGITTSGFANTDRCAAATEISCEIPPGHVFVMGDNRTGSKDSRVFGPIPEDFVVGRAFLRVWPLGDISFL
jgi:signal peptidase I